MLQLISPLETSRRQSTAQRAKITRKAGETRKKNKKAEKKNPQWKSSECLCSGRTMRAVS